MLLMVTLTAAVAVRAEDHALPKPYYLPVADDPAWLKTVVQVHGHLGPWVVIGARFGMAALKAVDARGYFDVQITCQGPLARPPQSCFLDGVQVGSGATLGKRTLTATETDTLVLQVRNTQTGKAAQLRPSAKLLELMAATQARMSAAAAREENHSHGGRAPVAAEGAARKIARWTDAELLVVTPEKPGGPGL